MKRISIGILMILLLFVQGCLKEDVEKCKSELLLRFRYTLNDQNINLFDAQVHKVTVYVFDKDGKYVGTFSEQGSALTNDFVMRIPLPEGEYSVIVYGGDFTTYAVGGGELSDIRMELKSIESGDGFLYPAAIPDDLYAGWALSAVSTTNNKNVTDVELIKNTKKITIKTSGIAGTPEVYITAINGKYQYDNNIDPTHGVFKYIAPYTSSEDGYQIFDLKMMRLMYGMSSRIVIRDPITNNIIYDENLMDLILATGQYPLQQDLDREDEFVVTIIIGHEISVWVNGWKVNEMNPDDI